MRILVTHLTRMQGDRICVAGIDAAKSQIRPVVGKYEKLSARHLVEYGGVFTIGGVVDIGTARAVGYPPEVEDHEFDLTNARLLRRLPGDRFWSHLESTAKGSLTEIFGPSLRSAGVASRCVDEHIGEASLGHLAVEQKPTLHIAERISDGKRKKNVRMQLKSSTAWLDLSVTDIRLHRFVDSSFQPDEEAIAEMNRCIKTSDRIILSVGLTRPFPPDSPVHWLQVNNIHCASEPLWQPNH